jgi:hypothetical protein
MKFRFVIGMLAPLALAGCGSITLPAAVKMEDGQVLTGTTTAAVSGGHFELSAPGGTLSCNGTYNALDTSPVLTTPVTCSDGRYGTVTVIRTPDGQAGAGTVNLASGERGSVAFGRSAANVLSTTPQYSFASNASGTSNQTYSPSYSSLATTSYGSKVYTGNCPTPESIAADGKRCGRRSAASRPGGYDGYGLWAANTYSGGGSTFVRGYYRKNGTYVRSHYRRGRR